MTGEMGWNEIKDYPEILALAKKIQSGAKVAAQVRPFDVYQGPFIAVDLDRSPVRNAQKARFGSWNIEVWYGDCVGVYAVRYKGKFKHGGSADVVTFIKKIKAEREKKK